MNRSVLSDLDSILSCPICLIHFDDDERAPIALNCKHVLCKICSMTIWINSQIKCSLCRRVTLIQNIDANSKKSFEYLYKEIVYLYTDHSNRLQLPLQNNPENDDGPNFDQFNERNKMRGFFSSLYDRLSYMITRKKPIRVAFLGKPKSGKSTLINTLRGKSKQFDIFENKLMQSSNDTAQTDVTKCTKNVRCYSLNLEDAISSSSTSSCSSHSTSSINKTNEQIYLCDLPSVGTPEHKTNGEYLKSIKFNTYDFLILTLNEGFSETDEWLLNVVQTSGKPFAIVFTKLDQYVNSEIESWDSHEKMSEQMRKVNEDALIKKIRNECIYNIHKTADLGNDFRLFLVSSLKSKLDFYADYHLLHQFVRMEIPLIIGKQAAANLASKLTNKLNHNSCLII